jgi:hypothetical protein
MKVDLHIHSIFSDGSYTPEEIVLTAKEKNIEFISVTDHDNLDSQKEAKLYASESKIDYITGVEISCNFDSMLDILGYNIDTNNNDLNTALEKVQNFRKNRNKIMIEKFESLGIKITKKELEEVSGGEVIGRPHFARILINKGYVKDSDEAFDIYLGDHKKAYIPKERIEIKDAIKLINNAGGVAVLAHPKYIKLNREKFSVFLDELKSYGLWGIEAYYSKNTYEENRYFSKIAKDKGLYITAGSDFHGLNKTDNTIGMDFQDDYLFESIKLLREMSIH